MGRRMKKPRNPFRVIRKAVKVIGYMLLALYFAGIFGLVTWGFWTDLGWGAWALTAPLIIVAGIIAAIAIILLICWPFLLLGDWWKKREWEHEEMAWKNRT